MVIRCNVLDFGRVCLSILFSTILLSSCDGQSARMSRQIASTSELERPNSANEDDVAEGLSLLSTLPALVSGSEVGFSTDGRDNVEKFHIVGFDRNVPVVSGRRYTYGSMVLRYRFRLSGAKEIVVNADVSGNFLVEYRFVSAGQVFQPLMRQTKVIEDQANRAVRRARISVPPEFSNSVLAIRLTSTTPENAKGAALWSLRLVLPEDPAASAAKGWKTRFDSANFPVGNIDDNLLINPREMPQGKLLLVTRHIGAKDKWPVATWNIGGLHKLFQPPGWEDSNNVVQRSLENKTGSSGFLAYLDKIAWAVRVADNVPIEGQTPNCYNAVAYRFPTEKRPMPWASPSGKLVLSATLKMPIVQYHGDVQVMHSKFELGFVDRVSGEFFWWHDKFFQMGQELFLHRVHLDVASNSFTVTSLHQDESRYHTRTAGSFTREPFEDMRLFQVSIDRAEFQNAIADLNEKVGSSAFSRDPSTYELRAINVNTELALGDSQKAGVHTFMLENFKVETFEE